MNSTIPIDKRNEVLRSMASLVEEHEELLLLANRQDMKSFDREDQAMSDRLLVDGDKIGGMVLSLQQLAAQEDPIGVERLRFEHENGMVIYNRTAAFGRVLIIYESRPDVTVEAAGIAFKSGNQILLKGGKEARNSNLTLVSLWKKALKANGVSDSWIEYLDLNRSQTQEYLKNPPLKIDLIIPRGGERLIRFVKDHATCPVIVSGRGNNFVYVHSDADREEAADIILNAKTAKISACNALDKVLIDSRMQDLDSFLDGLIRRLNKAGVQVFVGDDLMDRDGVVPHPDTDQWYEEFLDYKIRLGLVSSEEQATEMINTYGGGHSAAILSNDQKAAGRFMEEVDAAAVYHNASTRFTDGFQFGLGGELAISTDKIHQRGPIGLQHLVTNKWFVYGEGQIR